MANRSKLLIGLGVVLVALVAGGAWWYLKDDAAERVNLEDAAAEAEAQAGETDPTSGDTTDPVGPTAAADDPSGTWTVSSGSFAGYRIDEVLTGGVNNTATARTDQVSGTLTIDGTVVDAAEVSVDMGSLSSTDGNGIRDGRVRGALDTGTHPAATFVLTRPIDLGSVPTEGEAVSVTATGDLTLKGVTRSVDVAIEAQLSGANLLVVGNAPIVLADHDIEAPSAGRVVSIEDAGELEFQLIFART